MYGSTYAVERDTVGEDEAHVFDKVSDAVVVIEVLSPQFTPNGDKIHRPFD